jgi:hypothetical protein
MDTDKHGGYMELLEKDLTEKIIAACLEVSNELGAGFLESVYERAILIALRDEEAPDEEEIKKDIDKSKESDKLTEDIDMDGLDNVMSADDEFADDEGDDGDDEGDEDDE